jgi:hypothetical protein
MSLGSGARVGAIALALIWLAAAGGVANAAGLKCECSNCTYKSGRTQANYNFDPNFNSTAAGRQQYNAAERAAMNEADKAADDAIAAAMAALPSCPDPCEPQPIWDSSHGPPFAGGTGGNGIARSLWKVTYSCTPKLVIPPPPVLVAVSTTCPSCQEYVDQIHALDIEIMQYYENYVKLIKARDELAGIAEAEMNFDEGKRAGLIDALRKCENSCPRPVQYQTVPGQPQSTPAQPGFGFGGFYFGGGGGYGGGGDFGGGEPEGGRKFDNNKGRSQK